MGVTKKNAPIFPEFGLDWIIEEMENGLLGYDPVEHQNDYFTHTDECYQALKRIQLTGTAGRAPPNSALF